MKKILIVEDDQLVATAYRKRFRDAGWEVEWAPDGVEGIKAVGTVKPDVVLLDLLMPRLDGIEVLKYIRAHPDLKHLPVVVFSNSYMTNLIENAWRAGADQCLMKASTTPQALFDSIAKAMQRAAARKAAESVGGGVLSQVSPLGAAPRAGAPAVSSLQSRLPALVPPASGFAVEPRRPAAAPVANRPAIVPPVQPLATPAPSVAASTPLVAPVSSATASTDTTTTLNPASGIDPEFQAQIRQLFVSGAAAKLDGVRSTALALAQGSSGPVLDQMADLFRRIHSLTGNAAVAGCQGIAQYASTFEAFLQELLEKPRFINASTTRTVLKGIDFLAMLFQHALAPEPPELARRVLVVDGDPMSGQAISLTLEKTGLRTHLAGDPIEAMTLGSTENFDLIVVAEELPGMSGLEAAAQLETLPGCANVPVLFVSSVEQFSRHCETGITGEFDVIARPFLIIELTLKAMTLLDTRRFHVHFASAA